MCRVLVRLRRFGRRAFGGAVYGMTIAWALTGAVLYTPFALVISAIVMVASTLAAAVCVLLSGE